MSIFRRFFVGTAGNAATIFALALVPVFCVGAAAVDYARVTRVRAAIFEALGKGLVDLREHPAADARAQYLELREGMEGRLGPSLAADWKIESLDEKEGRFVAVVSAEVATSVARLIGILEVPITVTAEASVSPD